MVHSIFGDWHSMLERPKKNSISHTCSKLRSIRVPRAIPLRGWWNTHQGATALNHPRHPREGTVGVGFMGIMMGTSTMSCINFYNYNHHGRISSYNWNCTIQRKAEGLDSCRCRTKANGFVDFFFSQEARTMAHHPHQSHRPEWSSLARTFSLHWQTSKLHGLLWNCGTSHVAVALCPLSSSSNNLNCY